MAQFLFFHVSYSIGHFHIPQIIGAGDLIEDRLQMISSPKI